MQFMMTMLPNDKKTVLEALDDYSACDIHRVPPQLLDDRDVACKALRNTRRDNGTVDRVMEYIPRYFLRDWDFVEDVLWNRPEIIRYIDDDLLQDKKFLHRMVVADVRIFEYENFEDVVDEDFWKTLLPECGYALSYASEAVKGNKEMVTAAIQQNGKAIAFASEEVIDRDLCVLAARNGACPTELPEVFRNEPDVLVALVECDFWKLCYYVQETDMHFLEDRDLLAKMLRVATFSKRFLDALLPTHLFNDATLQVQRRVDDVGYERYASLLAQLEHEVYHLSWSLKYENIFKGTLKERNVARLDEIAECLPYAAASLDRERTRLEEEGMEFIPKKKRAKFTMREKKANDCVSELLARVEKLAQRVHSPWHPLVQMRSESVPFVS